MQYAPDTIVLETSHPAVTPGPIDYAPIYSVTLTCAYHFMKTVSNSDSDVQFQASSNTLVNVCVNLLVFTRIAGTS